MKVGEKFCCLRNISGASRQESGAAISGTTEVDGDLFEKCERQKDKMVPYSSTSSLFGTILQICFPPETYCRLQNFTHFTSFNETLPVPPIILSRQFVPHLRNKDQISVHLNAKKETMLRNSSQAIPGKEAELS